MSNRLFLIGCTLLIACGCQSGSPSTTSVPVAKKADFVRAPEYEKGPGQLGQAYITQRDMMIYGSQAAGGTVVYGLIDPNGKTSIFDEPKFLLNREFVSMMGNDRFLFAKHFGELTVTRFDFVNGAPVNPKPTEFHQIFYQQVRNTGPNCWIGVNKTSNIATVMNESGEPVQQIERISSISVTDKTESLASEKAYVLHGTDNNGDFDQIADTAGIPMSPKLPRLWSASPNHVRYYGEEWVYGPKMFAMVIDEKKQLYWPVLDDGKIFPKPDDCLGIQPVIGEYLQRERWAGWLVWWKTHGGPRCAFVEVKVPTTDFAALVASREQAKWSEIVVFYNGVHSVFDFVRRAEPNGPYQTGDCWGEMTDASLPTIEAAQKFLANAYEQHRIRVDRREAAWKAAEAEAANQRLRNEEEQKRAEAARAAAVKEKFGKDFDAAMARGDKRASRECVLRLWRDPERWTRYVRQWGLDPDDNSSAGVGYSRAALGGTDEAVLAEAVKRLNPFPVTNAGPQSDWDYFWNGPRDGSYSGPRSNYQVDPRLTPEGAMKALHDRDVENAKAWLRGAQNWGAAK